MAKDIPSILIPTGVTFWFVFAATAALLPSTLLPPLPLLTSLALSVAAGAAVTAALSGVTGAVAVGEVLDGVAVGPVAPVGAARVDTGCIDERIARPKAYSGHQVPAAGPPLHIPSLSPGPLIHK